RGRCPGVHGRDGAEAAWGHRQRGVVAQEVLRLPQRHRAQRRPRRRPARACRTAAGAGPAVLYPRGDRPSPRRDRDQDPLREEGLRDGRAGGLDRAALLRHRRAAAGGDRLGRRRDPAGPGQHHPPQPLLRPGQRAGPAVLPAAGRVLLHQGRAAMTTFTSSFASRIEAMLEWRTSLGHTPRDMTSAMAGFDRFCASHYPGETVLTRELATAWCRNTATGTWGAYRSRAVREFGKYLQLAGADAFIVPSAWIGRPARGLPHMFTDDELAAFFRAADSVGAEYRSPFREYAIPVIFRLILGA